MKKHVTISIYDADGLLCESVGGRMGYDEVKDIMINTLRNDGIPVIRVSERSKDCDEPGNKVKEHKEIVDAWRGKYHQDSQGEDAPVKEYVAGATEDSKRMESNGPLLTLEWEVDGIRFHAFGAGRDVIDAQYDFLRSMTTEEKMNEE